MNLVTVLSFKSEARVREILFEMVLRAEIFYVKHLQIYYPTIFFTYLKRPLNYLGELTLYKKMDFLVVKIPHYSFLNTYALFSQNNIKNYKMPLQFLY